MAIINISDHIFDRGRAGTNDLIHWLEANVGQYYCIGEAPVMRVGDGWEMRTVEELVPEGWAIHWIVDITDEAKATLFALRWGA